MRFLTIVILGVALVIGNPQLPAHELSLEYDSELQTNFKGDYNWANLLILDAKANVSEKFSIEAATISIAKTSDKPMVDDMQGYSNIEEDNLTLGIARLGVEYTNRRSTFFAGIRNVNEDYFTSPLTSLFVNSSCGIFPTLSGNYDIANYPLSSWCIHYKADWDKIRLQTSLYEGLGHRRIAGHDNVFKFSPSRDGIFSITSVEYDNNGNNYSLGCAVYYGVRNSDEVFLEAASAETSSASQKKLSAAPWFNIEHRVSAACTVMLQGSIATKGAYCKSYVGAGAAYAIGDMQLGLFADYARYSECSEIATELTCSIPITQILTLQPAIEAICTDHKFNAVGIMRMSIQL